MFNSTFTKPRMRPAINVGALMDIPTGHYVRGKYGEHILNGGVSNFTGICARPNNFKTALALYIVTMIRRAFHRTHMNVYDTEGTLNPYTRLEAASRLDPYLKDLDWASDEQFVFTDISEIYGDDWFAKFREAIDVKATGDKKYLMTTPFMEVDGTLMPALYPTAGIIDSFSKFQVKAAQNIYAKNQIGESGANTVDMMNGKAKNQMLSQIPAVTTRTGTYLIMTALLGDIINMDMFPTDKRNLSFMKKDTVLKGVSSGFYSLPSNCWMITSNKPLLTKDKLPEYPVDNANIIEGDTDLVLLSMINLRGKSGISGFPIELVVSQSEGILASLSEFHFCKENNRFGIGGNNINYFMDLLPDVSISRTKVRRRLEIDEKLQRAVNITAELLQMHQHMRNPEPPNLLCSPKELYIDLKAMGYDWDQILGQTRGYWVCTEDEDDHPKKFLSTMDLLRMRIGMYIPYWSTEEERAKIKLVAPTAA